MAAGGANQCQWTIEIRAHCDEATRLALTQTIKQLARHADATVKLLPNATAMKPEVVVYGDDFFAGHFEIEMLDDSVGAGIAEVGLGEEDAVSSELLEAARDMRHDANNKRP